MYHSKHTKCVQLQKFSGNANFKVYIETEFLRHPKHSAPYKIRGLYECVDEDSSLHYKHESGCDVSDTEDKLQAKQDTYALRYTLSPFVSRLPSLAPCGRWNLLRDTSGIHRITHSLHYLCIYLYLGCKVCCCPLQQTKIIFSQKTGKQPSLPSSNNTFVCVDHTTPHHTTPHHTPAHSHRSPY